MIRELVTLNLALLAGCIGESDPDALAQPLSTLPSPKLVIKANLRKVEVFIQLDAFRAGACPVLDESFEASVDATPMLIANRGASIDSIYSSDPCSWPRVVLDNPPAAASSMIAMTYPKHSIRVQLFDLLASRSAKPVPDGPWTFTPGQTITLEWSPADDLATRTPTIYFVTDDLPQTGIEYTFLHVAVTGDRMTFALPNATAPGSLQITLRNPSDIILPKLECLGGTCQLVETPHPRSYSTLLGSPSRSAEPGLFIRGAVVRRTWMKTGDVSCAGR